ncbi:MULTISPECIES: cytochrome P450 [Streptomyces]|uniref:Cytochrome P450 n=1 Tax=Streptomyces lavenduligriseus TaxID=67315 RepID=A0ABT0P2C2_9ACTN|nr:MULTISPECIES: cytochrome P450 [Streptomyces]MBK3522541.1 cytochrome P450 [Streptomyces sp. MBT70]MCL3997872.1 cytochrome P450 [Streptomyces lavenduligriseus]GGS07000.1 cytochrome P450 [Streptomyces eurythermus]
MTAPAEPADQAAPPDFPMRRACPFSPPAAYAELRETAPVSRARLKVNGKPAWLVTRHDLYKKLLGDERVSANLKLPGYPLQVPVPEEILQSVPLTFLSMDPPDHTVQRRMLAPEFSVRRMRELRGRVRQIVDQQIDHMLEKGADGPVDLVTALALPVPSLVICELLGVPYEDHGRFEEWAWAIMNHDISEEDRGRAHYELDRYVDGLVTAKESEPGDDMISRLIEFNRQTPAVEHSDIVSMSKLMLVTGHETTANMIALGVLALLEHPDQLAAVRAEPELMPRAVEELLRFFSISDAGTARVALEDIELGGVTIRAGEGILPLNNAANHDARVFPDPDRLDVRREARSQLAFGYGVHQCIGQNLARMELEVVYSALLERIPTLRLATPVEELRFKDDAIVYGLYELPVTW